MDTVSAQAAAQPKGVEYKIGLPAQRFVRTPQSPRSAVSSNASSPNVSAQVNACFTGPAPQRTQQLQQGMETGQAGMGAGQFSSSSSSGHNTPDLSDQTPVQAAASSSYSHKGKATHVKFAEPGSVIHTSSRAVKAAPVTQTAGAFAAASQGLVLVERQGSVASSDTSADVGDQKKRVGLIGRLRRQFSGRGRQDSI